MENLEEIKIDIEKNIKIYLNKYIGSCIFEQIEYSLLAGGKRFRPTIMLLLAKDLADKDKNLYDDVMPFAIAMEFIHTYSLIHDDLPAMDNDDYRRGRKSCHKQFDEAGAILAGDGLLNCAFEIMLDFCYKKYDKKYILASSEISKASGTKGMIGGQALDIQSENKKILLEELIQIYQNKTAKLIIASIKSVGIIYDISNDKLDLLEELAYNIGISFQIKDDLIDIFGDFEKTGKPIKSDEKNNKSTYVTFYGAKKAQKDYDDMCKNVLNILKKLQLENSNLYMYIVDFIHREK